MRPVLPAILLVLAAAPAPAKPAASDAPSAQRGDHSGNGDDTIVCRTSAPVGSLIANRKECRTKREWANMRVPTMRQMQGGSCASGETGHCE